jgi:sensor histidine kinase YesM
MSKLRLLLSFCMIFSVTAHANGVSDSLQQLLTQPIADTSRVITLNLLAKHYRNIDTKLAHDYATQALILAKQANFLKGVATASDVLGVVYMNKADYQNALYYFLTAMRLNESRKDMKAYASTCNNIGSVFFYYKRYDQALAFYQKSLSIKLSLGNNKEASSTYSNIGNVYMKTGDLNKCIFYYKKALTNSTLHTDTYNISIALMNLGEAYYDKKDYTKALNYYYQSLDLNSKRIDQFHWANTHYAIGKIYLRINRISDAEDYLLKGLSIAQQSGIRTIELNVYKSLTELFEQKKDYPKALLYYKHFQTLGDSIFNKEISGQLDNIQSKYEVEKRDKRIALLEKDKTINETNLYKEKTLRNTFIIAFVLVAVILGILIRNIKVKQHINRILKVKNEKIEIQGREIERQNAQLLNFNKELMTENIAAKYEILKSKIDPHFLFNSLNTLSSLIITEPNTALHFVARFSKLYRQILELGNHKLIAIDEELAFVNDYIYLQKMRFRNNLHYETIISDTGFLSGQVPPFSIQLLIENAIKHNIISSKQQLTISVFVLHDKVLVTNNLQLKTTKNTSTQIGQKNIIDRYKYVTDTKPQFEVTENFYNAYLPVIHA